MRIHVVEFAGKGGMIHYAWQLCTALAAGGAEVTLVTDDSYELDALPHTFRVEKLLRLWDSKPDTQPGAIMRRMQRVVRGARYYREWQRLIRFLRRERPDVVQFGDIRFPTDLVPLSRLRRSGLTLADICHNVHPFSLSGKSAGRFSSTRSRAAYRRIYEQFSAVFVHFNVNRREFEQTFGMSGRLATIVHGNESIFLTLRNPSVTAAQLRLVLGLPPAAEVVLLFGTLSKYKRADLLLDAFRVVHESRSSAHLVVAGFPVGGFDPEDIRRDAAKLGISDAVTVIPRYIPAGAVGAWMELASIVVFPYDAVFQSGAVHVPLTFGRPVIATSVGAMSEVITEGVTGRLVPPGDTSALAAAMRQLLEDQGAAEEMGRRAAEESRSRFSWSGIAAVILDRYNALPGASR